MAKTKISEFSATPANNTDIDSINLAEGCAPSGINDAIRELMAQLKDFQTGAVGDSFNGPVGTSTAAAGAFTTLSATGAITSTLATGSAPLVIASTTKVANLNVDLLDGADWAAPAALGSTTPAAVSATTLSASSTVTLSGGTANGVAYLNGSKVVTSGSALTFDGSTFTVTGGGVMSRFRTGSATDGRIEFAYNTTDTGYINMPSSSLLDIYARSGVSLAFGANGSEGMRLTSTGLGIGTSSPSTKLNVSGSSNTLLINGSGVNANYARFTSTGGDGVLGIESSTAGAICTNSLAYASLFYTVGATALQLGTNSNVRATISSAGNLGIGVNPTYKLDVWGSTSVVGQIRNNNVGTNTFAQLQFSTSNNYDGYSIAAISAICENANTRATALGLYSEGSDGTLGERARIDSSGNLGLGVTPSAWSGVNGVFEIKGNAYIYSTTGVLSSGANAYFNGTNWIYKTTQAATRYEQVNGLHRWDIAASGTAGNAITFTQAMTLDASGNLGVGTTSPSVRLHATGADQLLRLQNNNAYIQFANTANTDTAYIQQTASVFNIISQVNGAMVFGTNSTERARIDSSGNLLVGTTSSSGYRGDFVGNTSFGGLNVTGNSSGSYYTMNIDELGSGSMITVRINRSGVQVGSIATGASSTAYNTSSDYRLKNTIAPMTGAMAKVALLKPCTYKWNADGSDGQGFIAHELAEVVPQCVTGEKDGVNEDGTPKYQGIDTSFLVATLTAALQEAVAEINSLKARLDAANL